MTVTAEDTGTQSAESESVDPSASSDAPSLAADIEVTDEVIAERTQALSEVIDMLRPAVQIDGGDLEVVDVDYHNGIIEVQLQGACGSCAVSGATLTDGVERILKERLDWVTEIIGGVSEEIDPLESAALGRGAYVPKYY